MAKRWRTFLAVSVFLVGCAAMEPMQKREEIHGKGIPAITDSYAAQEIRPGETWMVYLKANHPDRGIKRIVCSITQPGIGEYPKSYIRVKPEYGGEIEGYIFLSTAKYANSLNMVNLTLTVRIEDQAGHFSEPVTFPLSMNTKFKQGPPPAGRFKNVDLGPIMIDVRSPADAFRG